MALTGLEIYKHLPKTNCGDCNFPTCMAFAMQLAAKKVSLDQCPHVSDEGKAALAEASAPPMKLVKIGRNSHELLIGQETVLFRHQEKFHHPTAIAVKVKDDLTEQELVNRVEAINNLHFVRVGEEIGVDLVAVEHSSTLPQGYAAVVKKVKEMSHLPLVLLSLDPQIAEAGLEVSAEGSPLIYAATTENWQQMAALAKRHSCPLAVKGESLEELADLTQQIKKLGVDDLVLSVESPRVAQTLQDLTRIRRLTLGKTFRNLGYPTITFVTEKDPFQQVGQATTYICKYGSIVVMEGTEAWKILPLLTVRQNIYTDPQVPNAVEAKLYQIGEVAPHSPVLVTTNFSLTYFTVEGEVENSKVPSYISVVETEGLGVLNAYAGDKWSAEKIGKTLELQKVKEKVKHNSIIIPGLVAVFRAELEEDFGWKVLVGPEEAARIPSFLKNEWKVIS
ncbi:MAG: acetyl-CoA decarbonylase/synthase complex subunit gamma [bacterium]